MTFVSEKYENVTITAKCINDTSLESKDVNDIVNYENLNFKRIKDISISGWTSSEERLDLDIGDKPYLDMTAEFSIKSKKEEDINHISKKLNDWFISFKPWYNFLTKVSLFDVFLSFLLVFFGILSILYLYLKFTGQTAPVSNEPPISTMEVIFLLLLILIIAKVIFHPIEKYLRWLFPRTFFSLGKQKNTLEKIQNSRKTIFYGLIIAIIAGILSGLLLRLI